MAKLDWSKCKRIGRALKPALHSSSGKLSTDAGHQLQVAIGSLKAPDAMLGVMGGPSKEEAHQILAQYGLVWDDAAYMAGGKGVKKVGWE